MIRHGSVFLARGKRFGVAQPTVKLWLGNHAEIAAIYTEKFG